MNFFVIGFLIMQAASFSVGDELGFPESLGNVESVRRRAISYKNGAPPESVGVLSGAQQQATSNAQQSLPDKRISSRSTGPVPYNLQLQQLQQSALAAAKAQQQQQQQQQKMKQLQQQLLLHQQQQLQQQQQQSQLMTEARPLPLGVPAFRPIPQKQQQQQQQDLNPAPTTADRRVAVDTTEPRVSVNNKLIHAVDKPHSNRTFHADNPVVSQPVAVPVFQAMPESIARIANAAKEHRQAPPPPPQPSYPNYLQFEEPKFDLKDVTVEELASAANVTVETIKHAIYVREQQLKAEHRAQLAAKLREEFMRTSTVRTTTTTTTTTPSTPRPQKSMAEHKVSKVMNAPKEYYPVGYDKNFDDNFKAKVDLPPTSFSCAKQKHFPGLYADTDLGCMVFHVCALTDDGLVRKSFLCPENTLFDQTILKCNWWFYVDCSSSTSIYDSNIPISKSYQLMKSLTYFSKFNNQRSKEQEGDKDENALDIESLRESMEGVSRRQELAKKAELEREKQEERPKADHEHVVPEEGEQQLSN
ncbi:mediator of RNA polymerase II transcription subunit 15 [Drosophila madeirensis]|uniref:Mediator of RNA polymerase II transcription subunit 15 n=1 Tax=Drosophila madeirensis TaxID=30013 RepID=A0AAU9EWM4_DROMD